MNIIGIDPGLNGGICVLNPTGIVDIIKMPLCTRPHRKGNYIDLKIVYEFITKYTSNNVEIVEGIYIERQFILRSQGMSSGSKTMYQFGLLHGLCFAQCDNLQEINAQDWQTSIFKKVNPDDINPYNYKKTKLPAIAYVEQTYGNSYLFTSKRQTKPSDGLADAICIAAYGLSLKKSH